MRDALFYRNIPSCDGDFAKEMDEPGDRLLIEFLAGLGEIWVPTATQLMPGFNLASLVAAIERARISLHYLAYLARVINDARPCARDSSGAPTGITLRICIIQSCYIPWKGFFDLIGRCDEYVIFDSAQYVKRHWHNRNRIKTGNGVEWLTIPVVTKGRFEQPIDQVEIEKSWAEKHWHALELAYRRAPFFGEVAPVVKGWYERAEDKLRLTEVNEIFLRAIADLLGL